MIVLLSLWRRDAARGIEARAAHLLSKRSLTHGVRWLWAVGDSDDETEVVLRGIASSVDSVTVVRHDSGIVGEDVTASRCRGAWTASRLFADLAPWDEIACLHESDLRSPVDVLDRFLTNPLPVAGWPTIRLNGHAQFYDVWAYRTLAGRHFGADTVPPPAAFNVGSFGSCWMAPASLVKDRMLDDECVVGLCKQWRSEGVSLWVDPTIAIEQPVDLWEPR